MALERIRIVLADDHAIYREGFKALLKDEDCLELVAEAADGKELLQAVDEHAPNVVFTDIKMPRMDGIEASKALKQKYPSLGIVALSMYNGDELIADMMEAGARGYLLKNTNKHQVVDAARSVYRGGSYYCSSTSEKLTGMIAKPATYPQPDVSGKVLTEREMEIAVFICKEYSNKEIAAALSLAVRTVESYREKIQEKIGSRNLAGIVVYAIKTGIYMPLN